MTDAPSIAIDALARITMPDHDKLRAVAVLAIALTAEEEDGRANGLDDAEVERQCRAIAEGHAGRVRLMYAEA